LVMPYSLASSHARFARLLCIACALLGVATKSFAVASVEKDQVTVAFVQNTAAEFSVNIDFGDTRYRFATYIDDFTSDAVGLSRQRALSGWKNDMLFVRQQCGQKARWRCVVDHVFVLRNGALTHLGAVESRGCTQIGCRYDKGGGAVQDMLDVMQINPITGAEDSVPIEILRRVEATGLPVDIAETWKLNEPLYRAAKACLVRAKHVGFDHLCEGAQTLWGSLVYAAKLTRYTARHAEWHLLMDELAPAYCVTSLDSKCAWRIASLREQVQTIQPGEVPKGFPSPVTKLSIKHASRDDDSAQALPTRASITLVR
jgi:hypothetical protein